MITKHVTLDDGSEFTIEEAYEGAELPVYFQFDTEDGTVERYLSNEDVLKIKNTIFEYFVAKGNTQVVEKAMPVSTEPELELRFS